MVYKRVNVVVGNNVELMCNTSLSPRIMWTYDNDTDDGYVHYVYWQQLADKLRMLNKSIPDGVHSLPIVNAEWTDSGLYNCYDEKGSRQVGYQLVVNGMFLFIIQVYLHLYSQIIFIEKKRKGLVNLL